MSVTKATSGRKIEGKFMMRLTTNQEAVPPATSAKTAVAAPRIMYS